MKLAIKIKGLTRILKSPRIISGGGAEESIQEADIKIIKEQEEGRLGLCFIPTRWH